MTTATLPKPRFDRLHQALSHHAERGHLPGLVALVSHHGDVHVEAIGTLSFGDSAPMRRDTIFRIASLTKPMTAAAAMMLVDDGTLALDDAVERWLPELANRRVLKHIAAPLDDTVPARRSITVRDLLTSTFGFGSVMAMPGTCPIQQPIRDGRLYGDDFPHFGLMPGTDDYMRKLGALPLMHQPGERWLYHTSYDVLGVLVARASGKTFEAFLRERLFGPLGMKNTAFSVPAEQLDRLPALYQFNHDTQAFDVFDHGGRDSEFSRSPAFQSGAGGLASTADDYHAFCRMLLDRGACRGGRVLSPASVDAMTRDQLTLAQRQGTEVFLGNHGSWGFGMAVDIQAHHPWNVPGRFGWDGGFGTSAYADPTNDFVGILLTQRLVDSPEQTAVSQDFWAQAYRLLGD